MIDAALADKFVKKATNYTAYNINIMNDKGIIIASADQYRVGSFHEVAYNIITGSADEIVEVVSGDRFQGGRTGINMAIMYNRKRVGVIGISGEPDEIREAALLIKMALETMLEYEAQNKRHYQKQSLRTRFIDGLLYQEETDKEGELTAVSQQLGYDPGKVRVPILITFDRQIDAYGILSQAKENLLLTLQDISAVTRNNSIIVFRSFRFEDRMLEEFRDFLDGTLEPFARLLAEKQIPCRCYVGSFQNKYRFYRKGYQHCIWLKEHCRNLTGQVFSFYDHVGEYVRDMVPVIELNRIFSSLCEELNEETKTSTIELVEALHRNNYNLNETSKELYVHKNTLIFRYNKIKNMFHVNPIQSMADREFLSWLVLYLKKNR